MSRPREIRVLREGRSAAFAEVNHEDYSLGGALRSFRVSPSLQPGPAHTCVAPQNCARSSAGAHRSFFFRPWPGAIISYYGALTPQLQSWQATLGVRQEADLISAIRVRPRRHPHRRLRSNCDFNPSPVSHDSYGSFHFVTGPPGPCVIVIRRDKGSSLCGHAAHQRRRCHRRSRRLPHLPQCSQQYSDDSPPAEQ